MRAEAYIKLNFLKPYKELIPMLMAVCNVSRDTAIEYWQKFNAAQMFQDQLTQENCPHCWSAPFTTAGGLMKECLLCRATEEVKISEENKI